MARGVERILSWLELHVSAFSVIYFHDSDKWQVDFMNQQVFDSRGVVPIPRAVLGSVSKVENASYEPPGLQVQHTEQVCLQVQGFS